MQAFVQFSEYYAILNRGIWLRSRVNVKEANKQAKIYVGRSLTLHIFCFIPIGLCMNSIIAMLLLVSCMNTYNHLLYFGSFLCSVNPKIANKNKELCKVS